MTAAPSGMCFNIDPSIVNGVPTPLYFADTGSTEGNAESAFPSDWILIVTGVPAGTSPATIAALIVSSPVAIPLPFIKSKRFQVAYSSLGSACTASVF